MYISMGVNKRTRLGYAVLKCVVHIYSFKSKYVSQKVINHFISFYNNFFFKYSYILISFHFAYDSMMTTVDNKDINCLNRIYLIIYHILLWIYWVID